MSDRVRYQAAGLGLIAIAVVVVAAMFGAIDLRDQDEVDALTISGAVYATLPPVTQIAAGSTTAPTAPPAVSPPSTSDARQRALEVVPVDPAAPAQRGTPAQITDTLPPATPMWSGPIPEYGNRGRCTIKNATIVTAGFAAVGATRATQEWALWVASRETGCDTSKRNLNDRTRDDSYGWCQLNARSGHFGPNGILNGWDRDRLLVDLEYATAACAEMWTVCGRGPWNAGNYYCERPEDLR